MSVVTIYRERLPFHPLLGRNVHLDSRSWDYAIQGLSGPPVVSTRHESFINILDQGQIGACTGNGATSCAYHAPFFSSGAHNWKYTPDEPGALTWYSQNTRDDSYSGTWVYPPVPGSGDDTGSDSTTASKVAKDAGIISGYRMAPDLNTSLEQLVLTPGITGIPWFNSMFDAPSSGLLTVTQSSGLAGGHELCVDEVVTADAPGNGTGKLLVGGPNSWGPAWGDKGRWYLTGDDWWTLRQQQGDVFFWVPNIQPAPTPTPTPSPADTADAALWALAGTFAHEHHALHGYTALANGLNDWARRKGFES